MFHVSVCSGCKLQNMGLRPTICVKRITRVFFLVSIIFSDKFIYKMINISEYSNIPTPMPLIPLN